MSGNNFKWSQDYSVGNELLDAQHQKILKICEDINARIDAGATDFSSYILALSHYAQTHFKTEENLLHETGYPDLESHEQAHRIFYAKLAKLHVNNMHGRLDVDELREFVNEWWLEHILIEDMEYRPYFSPPA